MVSPLCLWCFRYLGKGGRYAELETNLKNGSCVRCLGWIDYSNATTRSNGMIL